MTGTSSVWRLAAVALVAAVLHGGSAGHAPVKCRVGYSASELERYLSRARIALWLPGTRTVALDSEQRCVTVTVDDSSTGRLAKLALRAVSVPRRAIQIQVSAAATR
jgi:hypothetical protein